MSAGPLPAVPPLVVTARPSGSGYAPARFSAADAVIVRADQVQAGDLILAWFPGRRADYFTAAYRAEPGPYDPSCGCGVCGLLAGEPGPVVVLSRDAWDACDPHVADEPLLVAPRTGRAAAPGDRPVICCAPGRLRPPPAVRDLPHLAWRDRHILHLARQTFPSPGIRDRMIRERIGVSPTRYFQLLNALLDDVRALAYDPVTVNRLRRIRERNRALREGRTPP